MLSSTTHPSHFLSDSSLPDRFSVVARHFSLDPSPLKPDDAYLTFVMTPSLLHIVLSNEPPRRSPPSTAWAAPLMFVSIRHNHRVGGACTARDSPETRRHIQCLLFHCNIITYGWMSCISARQKYDVCRWTCNWDAIMSIINSWSNQPMHLTFDSNKTIVCLNENIWTGTSCNSNLSLTKCKLPHFMR